MAFVLRHQTRASDQEISDFEGRVGMRLPDDYRQFLAANSGGQCVSGGVFRDAVTGEKISRVNIMLGLREDDDFSLESHMSDMEGRMPPELLPIAYDSGGNYLLLDCSDAHTGAVYFLGLESADPDDPPSLESLSVVSRSFADLLAQLESDA